MKPNLCPLPCVQDFTRPIKEAEHKLKAAKTLAKKNRDFGREQIAAGWDREVDFWKTTLDSLNRKREAAQ
jgi:hypothetical protein